MICFSNAATSSCVHVTSSISVCCSVNFSSALFAAALALSASARSIAICFSKLLTCTSLSDTSAASRSEFRASSSLRTLRSSLSSRLVREFSDRSSSFRRFVACILATREALSSASCESSRSCSSALAAATAFTTTSLCVATAPAKSWAPSELAPAPLLIAVAIAAISICAPANSCPCSWSCLCACSRSSVFLTRDSSSSLIRASSCSTSSSLGPSSDNTEDALDDLETLSGESSPSGPPVADSASLASASSRQRISSASLSCNRFTMFTILASSTASFFAIT